MLFYFFFFLVRLPMMSCGHCAASFCYRARADNWSLSMVQQQGQNGVSDWCRCASDTVTKKFNSCVVGHASFLDPSRPRPKVSKRGSGKRNILGAANVYMGGLSAIFHVVKCVCRNSGPLNPASISAFRLILCG